MGNINCCCGDDEEDYKQGAWHNPGGYDDDDTEAENINQNGDSQYSAKAPFREKLILLHEQSRRTSESKLPEKESDPTIGGIDSQSKNQLARLKRRSITCTPMKMTPSFSFTPPRFPKSPETTELLLNALAEHFVFASIDEETKLQFVDAMQSQEFDEGDWVMHQGDVGDYFYIVEDGEVAFHVGEGLPGGSASEYFPLVGTGMKGSTFGELALLYNTPRAASVRASAPSKLYKIDQLTFRSLLMSQQVQDRSNIISLVKKISAFRDLDEQKLQKLADAFTMVEFGQGERIVNKGDPGDVLYVVKSGLVKIHNIGHGNSKFKDQALEEGNCFGERALVTGETRAANVTAVAQSLLLAISKRVLENIIGPLEQAIMQSSRAKYLRSIPLFEHLEGDEVDRCVMHLKEVTFEKGDKILSRGKLYLIEEGHALMMLQEESKNGKNLKGPKLVKLEKGDYFGDLWGSGEQDNGSIPETTPAINKTNGDLIINAETNMKCLTLLYSDVQRVIGDTEGMTRLNLIPGDKLEHGNNRPKRSRFSQVKFMQSQSSYALIKSRKSIFSRDVLNLSKLKKHRILGIGTFGQVWLVTPKSDTKDKPPPYALKMISKHLLLEQSVTVTVLREKNVMESIDHPFLMHLISSFQDVNYLYFVMDLILGGELFELIYSGGKKASTGNNAAWKDSAFYNTFGAKDEKPIKGVAGLGVRKAVFYGACIIDAFAYLHNRRIVYRDLKPENILLNRKGYCIVVDMGFAKVVLDKTYTVCGTLEYLSPEVIVNKGHNHATDYWSFACLLYELIVGQTPFFEKGLDQMSLLKKIVKAQYTFPDKMDKLIPNGSNELDKALCHWKDLVSRLLKPKSVERLGNLRNGIDDILNHDWFENIDFNEFRNQSIPAPWIPTIVDPMDTSHFGNFKQQEKPEVFARKLSAKDQEAFKDF